MNVLCIDTATEILGVGLSLSNGNRHDRYIEAGFKHAEVAMDAIDSILGEARIKPGDLELVVCSKGPGSFTGLRIGMATAKGLSSSLGIPLVSVPTLDSMALAVRWYPGTVIPVIDARKKRVYAAEYRQGVRSGDFLDITVGELLDRLKGEESVLFTGPGTGMLGEVTELSAGVYIDKRGAVGWNGEYVELGKKEFEASGAAPPDEGPEYIRKSDAEINLERTSGR